MEWEILDTGPASAEENMALDAQLLENLAQPTLHFYEWDAPSATYGHFVDPAKYLNLDAVEKHGLQLAKRPTGGGIIFHLTDFAFSILIPSNHPLYSTNTLENYATINTHIAKALEDLIGTKPSLSTIHEADSPNFCMAKPTKYDLILDGKKIGGAAQRRTKKGFLHHGTISLKMPPEELLRDVLIDETIFYEMKKSSSFLLSQHVSIETLFECKKTLTYFLIFVFTDSLQPDQ